MLSRSCVVSRGTSNQVRMNLKGGYQPSAGSQSVAAAGDTRAAESTASSTGQIELSYILFLHDHLLNIYTFTQYQPIAQRSVRIEERLCAVVSRPSSIPRRPLSKVPKLPD